LLCLILLLCGCSTVGFHSAQARAAIDYGPSAEIKVCFIAEPDVSDAEIADVTNAWNKELQLYKLNVRAVRVRRQERPGFFGSDILRYLNGLQLKSPCDRIVYLVGRTWGDIVHETLALGILA